MMTGLPRAQAVLVDRSGLPTREWYTYFLQLRRDASGNTDIQAAIGKILERLSKLEQSSPLNFQMLGISSLRVLGTPQSGIVQLVLDGDSEDPGRSYAYMTGPDGAKGWYLLADALAVTRDLTKTVDDETGLATFGLADQPDTGSGGALLKFTRDTKGRVSGTEQATTDDLSEGNEHLYFTDERAASAAPVQEAPQDGRQYARQDGQWSEVAKSASIRFPFYEASGHVQLIPLTTDLEMPFFLTDGTQINISMVVQ